MNDVLEHFSGQPVLVTGCSSGIGAAVTQTLQDAGAAVFGVDRNPPGSHFGSFLATDLGDAGSIAETISGLPREISAVFNCAGLSGGASDPTTVLRVNFIGLRELVEGILDRVPPGGAVVSTTSAGGAAYRENARDVIGLVRTRTFDDAVQWAKENEAYLAERGGYRVSKEALVLYTIDRCFPLGEQGIRINCVGPGVTDTPMLLDSARLYGKERFERPPQPLGRKATPQEQANILIFLNSGWASYINGEVIWSDGGGVNARILPD